VSANALARKNKKKKRLDVPRLVLVAAREASIHRV